MEDDQIIKTVESMLGKNIKIIDCEKKSIQNNEETLLINGIPVKLDGENGDAIKNAILTGNMPSCDLLNKLLIDAGIYNKSIRLETSLSVKSTTVLKEAITVKKKGKLLDERSSETKEDNLYTSTCSEIWEPIGIINNLNNKQITNYNNNLKLNTIINNKNYLIKNNIDKNFQTKTQLNNDKCEIENLNEDDDEEDQLKNFIQRNSYVKNIKEIEEEEEEERQRKLQQHKQQQDILQKEENRQRDEQQQLIHYRNQQQQQQREINQRQRQELLLQRDELLRQREELLQQHQQQKDNYLKQKQLNNNKIYKKNLNSSSTSTSSIDTNYSVSPLLSSNLSDLSLTTNTTTNKEQTNGKLINHNNSLNNKKQTQNKQTISIDSGNEEVSQSLLEQSYCNLLINKTDSMSSCCDFSSSTDEIDFQQSCVAQSITPPILTNLTSNFVKGKPQQLMPTIFGTVASNQCPKHHGNKKSLPQTLGQGSYSSNKSIVDAQETNQSLEYHDADENTLVYRDGNLVSGSLEALIQHMVPTCDYYPDRSYLFAFLLSSRLFIKPHELLEQITRLCDVQQNLNTQLNIKTQQQLINLKKFSIQFVQLITEWIETFPYDFRDERVMHFVRIMTQKCVIIEPTLGKDVSILLQNLIQRLTTLDNYEEFLRQLNSGIEQNTTDHQQQQQHSISLSTTSSTSSSSTTASNNLVLDQTTITSINYDMQELCPTPAHIAHQLTHIELERLYHIGPEEFVQAFAKENPYLKTTFKDMKKTRNLESYVQWFNRLSYFVATEIVKNSKKKQRVRIIEYWIETARECFNIGNFNSLMAIIAGLNMSPILRLKKTWAKIQSAKFSILEHQMDPTSNFNSYRSTLKAAMWRSAGATDERQRIVIPFFSLLVKDLYFLNEGCSNKLPNGHINFEKFWQLAKQVTEFITWKQVTCPFEKNMKIIKFLQTSNVLTENTLAMASFECEPPDNNHEKERFKTLKSEQNN